MRKIVYGDTSVILDEGVLFGKGVFETILCNEKPIFYKEHIKRLKDGMSTLGLSKLEEKKLNEFLGTIDIKFKVLKIIVTPNNIIVSTRENNYKSEDYKKGFSLKVGNVRRNSTSNLCYIKSINYIENIIEKDKAIEEGYNDVLFLNENNMITETSCANIFIVKNNKIKTPKIECGLLNGIIRSFITNNFQVIEDNITLQELKSADEIFITNSVIGIMPIVKVDRVNFKVGSIVKEVIKRYEKIRNV